MSKRSAAVAVLGVALLITLAGQASADEKVAPAGQKPGTITLKITTIVGNPPARPSAVIEINRAKPEIKLSDLQDPAVEKILRAGSKAPF